MTKKKNEDQQQIVSKRNRESDYNWNITKKKKTDPCNKIMWNEHDEPKNQTIKRKIAQTQILNRNIMMESKKSNIKIQKNLI